jgi:hypothetical protein
MAESYIEPNAPPSSYAIADVIEGRPGGWTRTFGLTLWRAVIISPGLIVAGVRGRPLVVGSLLGSVSATLYLLGYYQWQKAKRGRQ